MPMQTKKHTVSAQSCFHITPKTATLSPDALSFKLDLENTISSWQQADRIQGSLLYKFQTALLDPRFELLFDADQDQLLIDSLTILTNNVPAFDISQQSLVLIFCQTISMICEKLRIQPTYKLDPLKTQLSQWISKLYALNENKYQNHPEIKLYLDVIHYTIQEHSDSATYLQTCRQFKSQIRRMSQGDQFQFESAITQLKNAFPAISTPAEWYVFCHLVEHAYILATNSASYLNERFDNDHLFLKTISELPKPGIEWHQIKLLFFERIFYRSDFNPIHNNILEALKIYAENKQITADPTTFRMLLSFLLKIQFSDKQESVTKATQIINSFETQAQPLTIQLTQEIQLYLQTISDIEENAAKSSLESDVSHNLITIHNEVKTHSEIITSLQNQVSSLSQQNNSQHISQLQEISATQQQIKQLSEKINRVESSPQNATYETQIKQLSSELREAINLVHSEKHELSDMMTHLRQQLNVIHDHHEQLQADMSQIKASQIQNESATKTADIKTAPFLMLRSIDRAENFYRSVTSVAKQVSLILPQEETDQAEDTSTLDLSPFLIKLAPYTRITGNKLAYNMLA